MSRVRSSCLAGVLSFVVAGGAAGAVAGSCFAADAPTATATPADPLAPPQPPDGKWLRDADGHEYWPEPVEYWQRRTLDVGAYSALKG